MNLLLAGVNHQTARVDLREKLCSLLPEAEVSYPLLLSFPEIREVLFYATCNRVEVLCVTESEAEAPAVLAAFFSRHPEITPAAADFQVRRVAHERSMNEDQLRQLVAKHTAGRQLQFLGEPRVNVLELNLDLDATYPLQKRASK